MRKKRLYSIHSVFGGRDFYDENGQRIGYSVPSITGNGEDFVWSDGSHGYSVDSVIAGQDYHGGNGISAWTVPSVLGGEDIHGDIEGFSLDSPLGGDDIVLNED